MPTAKPRASITFDEKHYELLRELARINHESLSSVVRDVVQMVAPTLERVVQAGRHFEELSEGVQDQIRDSLQQAEARILPQLDALQADLLGAFDVAGLEQPATSDSAKKPSTDPRPVTRGSRPPSSPSSPSRSSSAEGGSHEV